MSSSVNVFSSSLDSIRGTSLSFSSSFSSFLFLFRKFEGQNPGLFYTFISRATWIGTPEERWKSAIFFSSKDMNFDRLWNLCCKPSTGAEYELVQQRRIWVEHLKNNLKRKTISEEDKADLINWANQTKIDGTLLNSLIAKSNWRTTTSLNY